MIANHLSSAVCCVSKTGVLRGPKVTIGTDEIFSDDLRTSELLAVLRTQMVLFARRQSESRLTQDKDNADVFLREWVSFYIIRVVEKKQWDSGQS